MPIILSSYLTSTLYPLIPILLDSLKIIFLSHPKFFFSLYILTSIPLSLLLTSLSLSTTPLKARVAHLHWLAHVVPIWVESDHVRAEAQAHIRALLRLKALHFGPILIFSLLSLISSVASTAGAHRRSYVPTLGSALAAVRVTWVRPLVTCVVNYAAHLGWALTVDVIAGAVVGSPAVVTAVVVAGVVAEVYLMAVLSLALVVSVVEDRAGFEAVRAGSGLMRGRRVCGWVLSGLVLAGSGCIGREMKGLMDGGDLMMMGEWTVGMRVGYMGGLVGLLGWVIMWSYVVITVLYFDCRKVNNVITVKEEVEYHVDNDV